MNQLGSIHTLWPYTGLALAVGAFLTYGIHPTSLDWLTAMQLPLYMLHQFEEHGIDLYGRHYPFLEYMRASVRKHLGFEPPVDAVWLTGVNLGGVWLCGIQASVLGKERPLIALTFASLMAVNTIAHVASALLDGGLEYNPGLATVVVLFVPASWALYRGYVREGRVTRAQAWGCLGSGVVAHAFIPLSMKLVRLGYLDTTGAAGLFYVVGGIGPHACEYLLG